LFENLIRRRKLCSLSLSGEKNSLASFPAKAVKDTLPPGNNIALTQPCYRTTVLFLGGDMYAVLFLLKLRNEDNTHCVV
jgi:hypothetical protein